MIALKAVCKGAKLVKTKESGLLLYVFCVCESVSLDLEDTSWHLAFCVTSLYRLALTCGPLCRPPEYMSQHRYHSGRTLKHPACTCAAVRIRRYGLHRQSGSSSSWHIRHRYMRMDGTCIYACIHVELLPTLSALGCHHYTYVPLIKL